MASSTQARQADTAFRKAVKASFDDQLLKGLILLVDSREIIKQYLLGGTIFLNGLVGFLRPYSLEKANSLLVECVSTLINLTPTDSEEKICLQEVIGILNGCQVLLMRAIKKTLFGGRVSINGVRSLRRCHTEMVRATVKVNITRSFPVNPRMIRKLRRSYLPPISPRDNRHKGASGACVVPPPPMSPRDNRHQGASGACVVPPPPMSPEDNLHWLRSGYGQVTHVKKHAHLNQRTEIFFFGELCRF